jgi:hypothetical protein
VAHGDDTHGDQHNDIHYDSHQDGHHYDHLHVDEGGQPS